MAWADGEMWRAVLASEPAAADDELNERIHHIHLVQRVWLDLWLERPFDPQVGSGLRAADLARWARDFYPSARDFIAATSDEQLGSPITMPWTAQVAESLGFEPAPTMLRDAIMQVYTHSMYHRGQVMTRLKSCGTTPPLVDYIAWVWRSRPDADWPI